MESTPPLNAIQTFFVSDDFNSFFMLSIIEFSINSKLYEFGISIKSFQSFFGKLFLIRGSYLSVNILTNDCELILGLVCSTT